MNRDNYGEDWSELKAFTIGINGGGPGTRTEYVFDNVDIPQVINEARNPSLWLPIRLPFPPLLLDADSAARSFRADARR